MAKKAAGVRRATLSVGALATILLLAVAGLKPVVPKPATAPATEFSAARAFEVLKQLVGDDLPHPVGSTANGTVRDRILGQLRELGYEPELQTAFACGRGTCATVKNVLARLEGGTAGERSAVLLSAHYDSVPAGPGVSDDAVGAAAVLEVARALKSRPPLRHPVVILIDDGEEGGLLGARAFIDAHRWAQTVRAAVNVEARGTSGPSVMFETGSANAWTIKLLATNVARPVTSSIFYTVYKQLPNDTDFTVFKAAGYQGLNFAFIGDVARYHTPLDNIANASAASLQHLGDDALASVLGLARADLSSIPEGEAVYFDLFHLGVAQFPAKWAVPLALATILLLALEIWRLTVHKNVDTRELLWGASLWLVIIASTLILALILCGLLRVAGALPVNWVAHRFPVELALWSLAASTVFTLAIVFGRRAGFWGLWSATWLWWGLLSLLVAWTATGLSYLLLVPAGMAAVAGLPAALRRSVPTAGVCATVAAIAPALAAGVVAFAPLVLLYDGMGNRVLPLIAVLVGLVLTPLLPLCTDILGTPGLRGALFSWIPITSTLGAALIAIGVPPFSAKSPEWLNIQYWKDSDTGLAQWIVEPDSGRLPEAIRVAATFQRAQNSPFPWDRGPAFLSPAPRLTLSEPSLTILESSAAANQRHYRALLRSERGAPETLLLFPPHSSVAAMSMQGHPIESITAKPRFSSTDWNVYRCLDVPAEGVEVDFTLPVGKTLQIYVVDVSYGLPNEGKFLLNSRPLTAVPSRDGDVTIVSRGVQMIP